jgi:hypothetical protein
LTAGHGACDGRAAREEEVPVVLVRAVRASLLMVVGVTSAFVVGLLTAASAQAATYQSWGYYELVGNAWTFAQKGPAQTTPADGAVEGWRWAITEESGTPPRAPRATPTFDDVCGAVVGGSDAKRVAVVVDYGRDVDNDGGTPPAPVARCAVVPTAGTGAEVLAAVASVRNGDGGMVCGIDGYPAVGCGGTVASLSDAQRAADTPVTLDSEGTATVSGDTQETTPGSTAPPRETLGPLISPAPASTTGSGVPVVVWVGLAILILGAAALAWTTARRRPDA